MIGDELRDLVLKRTGLTSAELNCPRAKSDMTPCAARDGDSAMSHAADDVDVAAAVCVGCQISVRKLLSEELDKGGVVEITCAEIFKRVRARFEERLRERKTWEPGYRNDEVLDLFDQATAEVTLAILVKEVIKS